MITGRSAARLKYGRTIPPTVETAVVAAAVIRKRRRDGNEMQMAMKGPLSCVERGCTADGMIAAPENGSSVHPAGQPIEKLRHFSTERNALERCERDVGHLALHFLRCSAAKSIAGIADMPLARRGAQVRGL